MADDRTPVLIGGGHFTQRTAQQGKFDESLNPMQMLEKAARLATADTGKSDAVLKALDAVAVVRFTADSPEAGRLPVGQYKNPPRSLAKLLGATPAQEYYTATGGNTS